MSRQPCGAHEVTFDFPWTRGRDREPHLREAKDRPDVRPGLAARLNVVGREDFGTLNAARVGLGP